MIANKLSQRLAHSSNHNTPMNIYVSDKGLNESHSFALSAENCTRVSRAQLYLLNKGHALISCQRGKHLHSDTYSDFIGTVKNKFESLKFLNCRFCSFQNPTDSVLCATCFGVLHDACTAKYVSSINGDTTYITKETHLLIENTLNLIMTAIDDVMVKRTDGFLLIRPPGHHSNMKEYRGFCFLNNVHAAYEYLKNVHHIVKVCILDYDVHHGNGTQELVYNNENVLFVDIHRYGDSFYPKTGSVDENNNHVVNIPLEKGSDEDCYISAFENIIHSKVDAFDPDVILVSCGFDAHEKDPMGGMHLKSTSYGLFHKLLKRHSKPILYFLEGGYEPNIIGECVHEIVQVAHQL